MDSHETAERKLIETDTELQQVKAEIIGLAATGEVPSPLLSKPLATIVTWAGGWFVRA